MQDNLKFTAPAGATGSQFMQRFLLHSKFYLRNSEDILPVSVFFFNPTVFQCYCSANDDQPFDALPTADYWQLQPEVTKHNHRKPHTIRDAFTVTIRHLADIFFMHY